MKLRVLDTDDPDRATSSHAEIGLRPRKAMTRGWWSAARLIVGLVISGVSLVLLLWNVEWPRFWGSVTGADYAWLALSVVLLFVSLWAKVLRWQLLLRPAGRVSQRTVLYSISVGYLVNTVLPGRLGELARVFMVSKLERLSLVTVLSTVVVDRILDVVALALVLALTLPTANLPDWATQSGLAVGAGGAALLVLCLVLAYPGGRKLFLALLGLMPAFPGKAALDRWAEALCLGMNGLRGTRAQLYIGATTAATWLTSMLVYYTGQLAFHIEAPPAAAALVMALVGLGMVVPSSPGYVGVFHYIVVLGLAAYGVEREPALGFAVVIHLVSTLPLGLLGAYSLWRCGFDSLGWRAKHDETEPALAH